MGQILQENIVRFNTRKHANESIYHSVNERIGAVYDKFGEGTPMRRVDRTAPPSR